jgi:TolB protein
MGNRVVVLIASLMLFSALGPMGAHSGSDTDAPLDIGYHVGSSVNITSDWEVNGTEVFVNSTVCLDGNLTILAGGSLTLTNATLIMNLSENGQHWIRVYGDLVLSDIDKNASTPADASLICSNDTEFSYSFDSMAGSVLDFANSKITDCGFSSSYKGIVVNTQSAIFEGMNFTANYYGLSLKEDGAAVRNCTFVDNYLGAEMSYASCEFINNTVIGSLAYGLYLYASSPEICNSRFITNGDGINMRYSEAVIDSCGISGSTGWGVNLYSSNPLIVNSTMSNSNELKAAADSFPRLLNTTLNQSSVSIGFGLHASVGQFVDVVAKDTGGTPMYNMTVTVLDEGGNPASSGCTDPSGWAKGLCYRERFLTRDGPIDFPAHRVMAFGMNGTAWFGENLTSLGSGPCEIMCSSSALNFGLWETDHEVTGSEVYSGYTIISKGNVQVDWGGSLALNGTELMFFSVDDVPLTLTGMDGQISIYDSYIHPIGTHEPLRPGSIIVSTMPDVDADLDGVELGWSDKFEIFSDRTLARNIAIEHAGACGIEIGSNADPVVENVTVDWAKNGINLASAKGNVTDVTLTNVRNYGLYAPQTKCTVSDFSVTGASKGIYALSSTLELAGFEIQSCGYGIHSLYSILSVTNSTVNASGSYGLYNLGSGVRLSNTTVLGSSTGIHLQDSDLINVFESCLISGNTIGFNLDECHPTILNSTLFNPTDLSVKRATTAALVNTTFQPSNISIQPSGHVDVGHWASVTVLDQNMTPVYGSKVAVSDSNDEVADSGVADVNGHIDALAFREERIFWNRSELHSVHRVLAYSSDGSLSVGENMTTLAPGESVVVILAGAGPEWIVWPDGHDVQSGENYTGKVIIAEGDVNVDTLIRVNVTNSTIQSWGDEQGATLSVYGQWNLTGSSITPRSAVTPLDPADFGLIFQPASLGVIGGSLLGSLKEMVTYTDNLTVFDSIITGFSGTGLRTEGASPTVENTTFALCHDGLTSNNGNPRVTGSAFVENGMYGLHASSGLPAVLGSSFVNNENGIGFDGGADGYLGGCAITENKNGVYIVGSSPVIDGANVLDNSNYGIYCLDSYALVNNSQITDNNYGVYCRASAPEIYGTNITSNTFGIYIHTSGPYVHGSHIDGNVYGIYDVSDAEDLEVSAFASGRAEEVVTFVTGGTHEGYAIRLPKRAVAKSANMRVEGIELRNEAVREDSDWQVYPNIYKDWVVWQDNRDNDWEIYAYNLSLDSDGNGVPNYMETPQLENDPALVRITNRPGVQAQADIWEDIIVWADLNTQNVNAYTFSNDTTWSVAAHPAAQWRPAIYGDHIVYTDNRNGHNDIYMVNISTGEVSRLSNSARDDMGAKIDDGKVVWYSYKGAPGQDEFSDIYYFDIGTWKLTNVTDDWPLQYSPDVFGDTILWHDNRQVNWEIFKYNITTGMEERLTFEIEQSFAPRIHGDRTVYYYHDRVRDRWSVRMYDLSAGNQTILETETYGDSQPVVYGDRVAWVNKSNAEMDIYVLDFNIIGYPHNVSVNVGADDDAEFQLPGEFNASVFLNEGELLGEIREKLPGIGGGTVDIPINVSFDGTGRIGLDSLSVVYDLPTIIEESSVSGNSNTGAYCADSTPRFVNCSLAGNPVDFYVRTDGNPVTLNSTFSETSLSFNGKLANLTVMNYLHLRAVNGTGAPLNASAVLLDNWHEEFNASLGSDGVEQWIAVTDATYNMTGKHENVTVVEMAFGTAQFGNNPRDVDMSQSHWEKFSTDTTAPTASRPFPYPDWPHDQLFPTISVWVTDVFAVDPSTVRLYVQGYSVFYTMVPVPGGYNVSYLHALGFSQGETVTCRVKAEDYYGNALDYSWSFVIDTGVQTFTIPLETGWNLVSLPFQPPNTSLESVLMSIDGRYDQVQWFDQLDGWKTYSVHRPPVLNDLTTIDRTMGFWVHVTENCTLVFTGAPETSTSIPLYAGWNLVGYPTLNDTMCVGDALWGTSADSVEGFDRGAPYRISELAPTYVMKPGEGYWVHVPADTMWVINW